MRRKTRLRASRAIEGWFGSPGVRRYVALAERRSGKWTVRCADPQASNSSDEGVRSSFRKNGRHRVVPDFPSLNRLEVGAARPRLRRVRYRVGELASHQQHGDQAVSEERLFGSTAPPVLCQGAGNKVPLSLPEGVETGAKPGSHSKASDERTSRLAPSAVARTTAWETWLDVLTSREWAPRDRVPR